MSTQRNRTRTITRLVVFVGLGLVILVVGGRFAIKTFAGEDALNIASGFIQQAFGGEVPDYAPSTELFTPVRTEIELDETIKPFKQIGERLGDGATGNNFVTMRGVAVFDANGDGLMDLYFPQYGRLTTKKNDENHVLQPTESNEAKPSMLYLNMGNDENGEPIYKSVPDLMREKGNLSNAQAELLTENKYVPRTSPEEDPYGVGRIGWGAAAADFNADGRMDLLVLNHHYGMGFVELEYGVTIFPPSENIGRGESGYKSIKTALPPYLKGDMKDGSKLMVNFGGKEEPEGRNTLYLNMGDQDNDGIPEWKDATEEVGMHLTNWSSSAASIADIDRDGDLDVYILNFIDPDFWGFGAKQFSGNPNELWINQLAETGNLTFEEKALDYGVAGLHEEENLPSSMWDRNNQTTVEDNNMIYKGELIGAKADHSWAAQIVDFNGDEWPDLMVANDIGNRMRVYENQGGQGFKVLEQFHDPSWNASWMGVASGDLDGDLEKEDMWSTFGTQSVTSRNTAIFSDDLDEMTITALSTTNYLDDKAKSHHPLLQYRNGEFVEITQETKVIHSPYIAPDIVLPANVSEDARAVAEKYNYKESLASLEFAWSHLFFDVDNDGDLDIYNVGSLSRGNDDFLGEMTSSPGRLLINQSSPGEFVFADKTLEYQVLDIVGMEYDANPPRRKAPGTNWHKGDYVYLQDVDSYTDMGLEASRNSRVKDIFRMHEAGQGNVAADLNNDGLMDMVVCHGGGNNSNLPSARNLKVDVMGKKMAMPPPNKVIKAPTNFEPGPTFVYINGGAPEGQEANWVQVKLIDETTANIDGVGARVIANDRILREFILGGQSFSGIHAPIHFGLAGDSLEKLEITWASGSSEPQVVEFTTPVKNQLITIRRTENGMVIQ